MTSYSGRMVKNNFSLLPFNTFHINTHARFFNEIKNLESAEAIFESEIFQNEQRLILGGGSNILFTKDFDGIVVKNSIEGIELVSEDDHYVYIKVGSGENWHNLVIHSLEKRWYGLENLALIPGCAGAAPIQNIGAYGVELKDVFHQLTCFDYEKKEYLRFNKEECRFGYRNSIFKGNLKNQVFITDITLKLRKVPRVNINYAPLKAFFSAQDGNGISPHDICQKVIEIRQSKLPDPNDLGNAGSFFKNPIVHKSVAQEIKNTNNDVPFYPENENKVKLSAAWLIDQCGWKGYRNGNIGVHKKQALVLVNYGNAQGEKIKELAFEIQASINNRFGIVLEPEVNII